MGRYIEIIALFCDIDIIIDISYRIDVLMSFFDISHRIDEK